jgi:hypothetical protein
VVCQRPGGVQALGFLDELRCTGEASSSAGRADAERLAEAESREGVLCDAQCANQIALERLEE